MGIDYGDVAFSRMEDIEKNPNKFIYVFNCGYINIHKKATMLSERSVGYLLLYLHKGSLKILINDHYLHVSAGHVIIYKPGQVRNIIFESCEENERYYVYFQGEGSGYYLKQLSLFDNIVYKTGELTYLINVFKEIIEDFKVHNFDCDAYRITKLLTILTTVSSCTNTTETTSKSSRISTILKLMEDTYYCNYSLEYYAKHYAQSIPTFIRHFKDEVGIPPIKYLNNLKIEKAKMFLSTTSLSISSIAMNIGMTDTFYFCNFFKKNTGKSPSEYRNKSNNINF